MSRSMLHPKSYLEACGVFRPACESKDTATARAFLLALKESLQSGKHFLAEKGAQISEADRERLIGCYDNHTMTLICSQAYAVYAQHMGIEPDIRSIGHRLRPVLVRSGIALPVEERDGGRLMQGAYHCTIRLDLEAVDRLCGFAV